MALSYEIYVATGSQDTFSIPFGYLDPSHVFVAVDGTDVPFTFPTASQAQLATTPTAGQIVRVYRVTPRDIRQVVWQNAANLTATDLNISDLQMFYIVQEAFDTSEDAMNRDNLGQFDAEGRRIRNLGTPIEPTDAVTKAYADQVSSAASGFADLARDWATLITGVVDGSECSSKAYAIGGAGVTNTAGRGAAKEWAIKVGTVDGTEHSAKSYAQANLRGTVGGSAKDWAITPENTTVITGEYSAKHHAAKAAGSATASANSATASANSATASANSADVSEQWAQEAIDTVTEVTNGVVPIGSLLISTLPLAPDGYIEADGSEVDGLYPDYRDALIAANYPYGQAGNGNPLRPNIDDKFIRFVLDGNAKDLGMVLQDQFQGHALEIKASDGRGIGITSAGASGALERPVQSNVGTDYPTYFRAIGPVSDGVNGVPRVGNETYPKHIIFKAFIKAYGAINIQGMADLAALLAAVATPSQIREGTSNTTLVTPFGLNDGFIKHMAGKKLGHGLMLSNNAADPTNDIDVSAGAAVSDDGTTVMVLAGSITKRLDAAWSAGNNGGAMDTGTVTNTGYYVWLVSNNDGAADVKVSLSPSTPNMTGFTKKKCIGVIARHGNAIVPFIQYGNRFAFVNAARIYDAALTTAQANMLTWFPNTVDAGFKAYFDVAGSNANTVFFYRALGSSTDKVASRGNTRGFGFVEVVCGNQSSLTVSSNISSSGIVEVTEIFYNKL